MDIKKAFDSSDHHVLIFTLGKFGFSKKENQFQLFFLSILAVLYLICSSKVETWHWGNYNYFYSAYADDTTFFLKHIISIKHIIDTLFFVSYRLKSNLFLKRVQVVVCGMHCINLNIKPFKISGPHCSYNEKWKKEKNE